MAVPFRRTSKTAKRKRRTHKKLSAPSITIDATTGKVYNKYKGIEYYFLIV